MPELPEVETVMRGLEPHMVGRKINHVEQRRANLRFPFPDNFPTRLMGAEILSLSRRAKYILIQLDSGESWMIHLGMTGRFTINAADDVKASSGQAGHNSWPLAEPHDHVIITLDDGGRIVYNDVRRFGYMDLLNTIDESSHPSLKNIGPEPLSDDFNTAQLANAIRNKKSAIKSVMLDQAVVAGLGNIYICEALWRAAINPKKAAHKISKQKLAVLVDVVKNVLSDAIAAGGSSLKDYRKADGELGYFQHQWDAYGKEGEKCGRENCDGIIQRVTQSGRSTFYCPKHQK
ncbi:bifunctional DNA-formamidopyrimidine glycosylase/DNA-(apurinic or apyrimidinic site) lyase [Curvivirga aplysinae]|uniref:bifunctional DNA-formamidopyrimidine glycosylase/DNA-(apurinic or apyrimidinic site) lyase n=1 Tax=Curvivirga aplysinae TaxID=2529852 RepID=UPI0012BD26B7|nr:bifunctional DNA-formamidopyrimidine glycosylase/DNA-(apurinic or apyrimidinic site) lyase [Curvivirga aplysinae]MTI08931.1 bifunctional DNA-formamidopyrimidine glycosylase/DNA-(apurinic or apyrimidinic site) lyase [Curvivirga aplysinae]